LPAGPPINLAASIPSSVSAAEVLVGELDPACGLFHRLHVAGCPVDVGLIIRGVLPDGVEGASSTL
jgi:hypothetical protein